MWGPLSTTEALAHARDGKWVDAPLRIPFKDTGLWVYLRCWSRFPAHFNRSHGCTLGNFTANGRYEGSAAWGNKIYPAQAWCRTEGLPFRNTVFEGDRPKELIAAEMDLWLLEDLGAEVVQKDEWRDGCSGPGYRPDRPPFRLWSYTIIRWQQRMIYRWSQGDGPWVDHQPVPKFEPSNFVEQELFNELKYQEQPA